MASPPSLLPLPFPQVNSLIQAKLEPDFNMETEVSRNWAEIMHREYKFDRNLLAAEILKSVTQQEVWEWLRRYTKPGPDYKRLAVRVSEQTESSTADFLFLNNPFPIHRKFMVCVCSQFQCIPMARTNHKFPWDLVMYCLTGCE